MYCLNDVMNLESLVKVCFLWVCWLKKILIKWMKKKESLSLLFWNCSFLNSSKSSLLVILVMNLRCF